MRSKFHDMTRALALTIFVSSACGFVPSLPSVPPMLSVPSSSRSTGVSGAIGVGVVQGQGQQGFGPLYATETFQRSLLEARIANEVKQKSPSSSSSTVDGDIPGVVAVDVPAAAAAAAAVAVPSLESKKKDEAFHRSLLAAKIANDKTSVESSSSPAMDVVEVATVESVPSLESKKSQEAFRRSLLAAKIANDKTAAMMGAAVPVASAAVEAVEAVEASPVVAEQVQAKVVESEPEKEVETVAVSTPTPTTPTPAPATSTPAKPLQKTEFTVPRNLSLVPINESSVQFTAGLLGATAGTILAGGIGPLALLLAAGFNYLSRQDEDTGRFKDSSTSATSATSAKRIVDTASQTALLFYNYLAQFEKDNQLFDTTFKLMESAVDKAKQTNVGDSVVAVESTLGNVAKTVEELNDDYDLVGGAATVLNSVGDLVEISVDKVRELDEEYKFGERVGNLVKGAVGKVTGDEK